MKMKEIRLDLLTLRRNPQQAKFSLISLGFSGNTNTDQSKLNMDNLNQTEFTLKTWCLVTIKGKGQLDQRAKIDAATVCYLKLRFLF